MPRVYHDDQSRSRTREWVFVGAILLLAVVLRFWNLALKDLWLDEVITALICLGRGIPDLPVAEVIPFSHVAELMTSAPTGGWQSVVAILQDPNVSHMHPPIFYVLMNAWYRLSPPSWATLAWDLRFVPAVLGVVSLLPMYGLLRAAFRTRPEVARLGAAAMAVSPLMLLISQEARNYTLPTIILLLALWTVVAIARAFTEGHGSRPRLWIAWVLLNAAGCYTHYYFTIGVGAQCIALAVVFRWGPAVTGLPGPKRQAREWVALFASAASVIALFVPWIPTLVSDLRSPMQAWLALSDPMGFVAQVARGPVVMFVAGPGGSLPFAIVVLWTAASILFTLFLAAGIWRGLRRVWADRHNRLGVLIFCALLAASLAELITMSLLLRETLFNAPRFSFVWYPPVCALLAAGLTGLESIPAGAPMRRRLFDRRVMVTAVIAAGVISAVSINTNYSFQKSFQPQRVAENINRRPAGLLAAGYSNYHEIVNAVSYAIALQQENPEWADRGIVFVKRSAPGDLPRGRAKEPDYIWKSLAALPTGLNTSDGVWVIAPGLLEGDFPAQIGLPGMSGRQAPCTLDPSSIFNSANNVRGPSGEWRSRRWLTKWGTYAYAYYTCAAAPAL